MNLNPTSISLLPSAPHDLTLHDYQREAVNTWLKDNGRGVFAMATGTGKTITALAAATQAALYAAKKEQPLLVLVIVPLVDLIGQWESAAKWFGFRPVVCHGSLKKTERDALNSAFSSVRSSVAKRAEMVITTADSLASGDGKSTDDRYLQRQLSRHNGPIMVVGDEMHSLGTGPRMRALPIEPTYTLGLSATPKRHGDEEGTDALLHYFGDPAITISIKEAIYKYKTLVEYDYYPTLVRLTAEENDEYRKLSARIAAAYANDDQRAADSAIRQRNRVKQHAANKFDVLRELFSNGLKNESQQIIYTAEGMHPESDVSQLSEVESILRDEFEMSVARYYGETPTDERAILQQQLANGDIQALLAMKCLDEGVDIPSVRVGVITASTQNPRQFVQRRGRLLRRDPVNPKSHATIYDFIVLPINSDDDSRIDSEKTLIGSELSRAAELADAARNREVIYDIIEWAYENQLSDTKYHWMKLTGEDEMTEWVR